MPGAARLPDAEIDVLLDHRIPARMRELHAFIVMAGSIENHPGPIDIVANDRKFELSTREFLLHPLADAGALIARALLHFVGITIAFDAGKRPYIAASSP